jgi:hypothetical protein
MILLRERVPLFVSNIAEQVAKHMVKLKVGIKLMDNTLGGVFTFWWSKTENEGQSAWRFIAGRGMWLNFGGQIVLMSNVA